MSTHYYELRSPWARIKRTNRGSDDCFIELWTQGTVLEWYAGALTIEPEEALEFLYSLRGDEVAISYGGATQVHFEMIRQPRVDQIISEYGEIFSFSGMVAIHPRPIQRSRPNLSNDK